MNNMHENNSEWQKFLKHIDSTLIEKDIYLLKLYVWVLDQDDGNVYRYRIDHLNFSDNDDEIKNIVGQFLSQAGHNLDKIAFMITKTSDPEMGNYL